jgi:hypothetical protein
MNDNILEEYPKQLRLLRQVDPRIRKLCRNLPCDISDVQKVIPLAQLGDARTALSRSSVLKMGRKPKKYKRPCVVSPCNVAPILSLPDQLDPDFLFHFRKAFRDRYQNALTVQALSNMNGFETEIVIINHVKMRVRKGRRAALLPHIGELLEKGERIEIDVQSEEDLHAERDRILRAREMYRKPPTPLSNDVEDWTQA